MKIMSNCGKGVQYIINPSDKYSKYYSPTEHSVASEIILLFKGSYLQTVCSKGTQIVWDKIYKECDSKAYNIQYDCFSVKTGMCNGFSDSYHATVPDWKCGLKERVDDFSHPYLMVYTQR